MDTKRLSHCKPQTPTKGRIKVYVKPGIAFCFRKEKKMWNGDILQCALGFRKGEENGNSCISRFKFYTFMCFSGSKSFAVVFHFSFFVFFFLHFFYWFILSVMQYGSDCVHKSYFFFTL